MVFSNNHYNPGEYVLYPYESGVSSLTDNITIYTRPLVIDLSNGKFDKQSLYILLSGISSCGPVAEGNTELMDGFDYYIEYMVKKYNVELNLSYSQSEVSAYLVNMDDTDNEKRNFITQFSNPTQSLYDIINNADLKNSKPDE